MTATVSTIFSDWVSLFYELLTFPLISLMNNPTSVKAVITFPPTRPAVFGELSCRDSNNAKINRIYGEWHKLIVNLIKRRAENFPASPTPFSGNAVRQCDTQTKRGKPIPAILFPRRSITAIAGAVDACFPNPARNFTRTSWSHRTKRFRCGIN